MLLTVYINVVYLVIGYNITIFFVSDNYVINNDITNDTSFIVVYLVIGHKITVLFVSNNYIGDNLFSHYPLI